MSIQQHSKSAPQLSASLTFQNSDENTTLYKKLQSFVHLQPLPDHHTADLEATRRTVRFVRVLLVMYVFVNVKGERWGREV